MVITQNDREFACDDHASSVSTRRGIVDGGSGDAAALNATVIDVDALRDSLYEMSASLTDAVGEYKRWLESKESDFELRFLTEDISHDISMFNRLNGVVSRLRQARKRVQGWYSYMQELLITALDQLTTYSESVAIIRNAERPDITSGTIGGITFDSPLTQAKRNVSKIRSVQRHINTLTLAETRLKNTVATFRTQMESFSRGVVKYDRKLIDLVELGKAVDELTGEGTPLERVQQRLAKIINTTRPEIRLREVQPDDSLRGPDPNTYVDDFLFSVKRDDENATTTEGDSSSSSVLEKLRALSENTLYTDNTRENIESIIRIAKSRIRDDDTVRRDELERLADAIRGNTPTRVISRYRMQARKTMGIYLRLEQLNLIIKNLQPQDRELYEGTLREIYDETFREAQRIVETESAYRENAQPTYMDLTFDDIYDVIGMDDMPSNVDDIEAEIFKTINERSNL